MQHGYVYRIENDKLEGCYVNKSYDFLEGHCDGSEHPSPMYDKGIKRLAKNAEQCGFKDLTQLQRWFTSLELATLSDYGYSIKRIKGDITVVGDRQVLFIRRNNKNV